MAKSTLRLFVGVRLPQRLMSRFGVYMKTLQSVPALEDVRWTPLPNLHITLRFIGEVPWEQMREIAREIGARAGDLGLCNQANGSIAFERVIALPHRRPRVLALEPDECGRRVLQHDHAIIEEACRSAGVLPEARGFKPHMTVGRFRRPPRSLAMWTFPAPPSERFTQPEELIASELRPEGAVYRPLYQP